MQRVDNVLAELTGAELDRIAAFLDAMIGAVPGGLAAWLRHLVDRERDARVGRIYPLRTPDEAIDDSELDAAITAAVRLRVGSIDRPLAVLLDVAVPVLARLRGDGQASG